METSFVRSSLWILLSSLTWAACASSPKTAEPEAQGARIAPHAPGWAQNPGDRYPETRYLTAIGIGANRNAAIDDARKQMAESFVVKVRSETQARTQANLSQDTAGAVAGATQNETDKTLTLSTETFLRGAEVKETAPVGSEVYALVAVDKLKARSGLMLEAQKVQARLNPVFESLEQKFTQEKFQKAKQALAEMEQLYGEASALGMSALVDVAPYEARIQKIENQMRARNEKWVFSVKTNAEAEFFVRDLESCMNDRGAMVYVNEQSPENVHQVEVSVIERPQHQKIEGWDRIRFDATAAMVRKDGRKFRVQTSKTETGRSREAILESVSDSLSKELCEKVFARMGEV